MESQTWKVAGEIRDQYLKSRQKHATFNSAHEGYAVMLEEFDELWQEVKAWKSPVQLTAMHPDDAGAAAIAIADQTEAMRKEAYHVAAMAMAFIIEVTDA